MKQPKNKLDAHPRSAGYVLLTVLIAVGVITGLVAAYGRHVIVEGSSGMSAPPLLESREACFSGVHYARQALVSGAVVGSHTVPSGSGSATYTLTALPLGNQALEVQSVGVSGFGARRLLEVGVKSSPASVPVSPATLPTLDAASVASLAADTSLPVQHFTSSATLHDAELTGLMVIHPGVDLVLDNVVLKGAFVSSKVMDQSGFGSYDAATAPHLIVDGNLTINSHPSLPGVAVLMPDGAVSSVSADARVQIYGDVVAHDVQITNAGTLAGNVSAVQSELASKSVLDRLGMDRKALEWSDELQLGGVQEPVFLASVPSVTTNADVLAIINYWSAN